MHPHYPRSSESLARYHAKPASPKTLGRAAMTLDSRGFDDRTTDQNGQPE
jgi:hypothetical protein